MRGVVQAAADRLERLAHDGNGKDTAGQSGQANRPQRPTERGDARAFLRVCVGRLTLRRRVLMHGDRVHVIKPAANVVRTIFKAFKKPQNVDLITKPPMQFR